MRLGHIEGTIMYKDEELCYIDVHDTMVEYRPIGVSKEYVPWEFIHGYSANAILDWLQNRLPDDNRQGLYESCQEYGIDMIGEEIFKISNGRSISNKCWLRLKDGPQTSAEVFSV